MSPLPKNSQLTPPGGWWLFILLVVCACGRLFLPGTNQSVQAQSADQQMLRKQRKWRKRARRLVKLRVAVDQLMSQLKLERTQHLMQLRGLEARRGQLKLLVDQEQLRLRRLREQILRLQQKLKSRKQAQSAIHAALNDALKKVRQGIENSLPFRRKERMALLDKIEARLKASRIDAEQGVSMLWRVLEDELRLTALVERAEIPLVLKKGQPARLVKVVRVGMIALFVLDRKNGARYGRMVRTPSGSWVYRLVTDEQDDAEIDKLFSNLSRQIREGRYTLPLFTSGGK